MKIIYKILSIVSSILRLLNNNLITFYWSHLLKSVGKNLKIYKGTSFSCFKNIILGNNCLIQFNCKIGSELPNGFLEIHNGVQINSNVQIDFSGGLVIEDNVLISSNVLILTHSHGYNPRSKPEPKPLRIKENVWIGTNVIICENVSLIEENSIIASGSIVTKDVKANSIYGGNPAKFIKSK